MATGPYAYSTTAADNGTASSEITWADSMNAASVDNSARQMMADLKKLTLDQGGALTLAGSANTYTLTTNAATDTLADGMRIVAVVNAANTGASTLNVNSKGAKAIRKTVAGSDIALVGGEMQIGDHAIFEYDASANSAAGAWILLNPAPVELISRGNVLCPHENLIVKYTAATTVDIDSDAVVLFDTNGVPKRFTSLNETLDITASGGNGLDTGAEGSSTWYHIWAIGKADGTLDGLLSASATAPMLPAGYTFKGYLGAVYNDGSSNFVAFLQRGARARIVGNNVVNAGNATTYTSVSLTAVVPPTATAVAMTVAPYQNTTAAITQCFLSDSSASGTTGGLEEINNTGYGTGSTSTFRGEVADLLFNSAQTFKYYLSGGTAPRVMIGITGWSY